MVPTKRNDLACRSGRSSALMDVPCLVQGEPDRTTDARSREPRGDRPVLCRLQAIEHDTAVDERTGRVNERRIAKEPELSADRGPTQTQLGSEARGPSRSERKRGDDPPASRIGEEFDPRTVSFRHSAPSMDGDAYRRLNPSIAAGPRHRCGAWSSTRRPRHRCGPSSRRGPRREMVPLCRNHLKDDAGGEDFASARTRGRGDASRAADRSPGRLESPGSPVGPFWRRGTQARDGGEREQRLG